MIAETDSTTGLIGHLFQSSPGRNPASVFRFSLASRRATLEEAFAISRSTYDQAATRPPFPSQAASSGDLRGTPTPTSGRMKSRLVRSTPPHSDPPAALREVHEPRQTSSPWARALFGLGVLLVVAFLTITDSGIVLITGLILILGTGRQVLGRAFGERRR